MPGWPRWDKLNVVPRKRKNEAETGQEVLKAPQGKAVKKESEKTPCVVQVPSALLQFGLWR